MPNPNDPIHPYSPAPDGETLLHRMEGIAQEFQQQSDPQRLGLFLYGQVCGEDLMEEGRQVGLTPQGRERFRRAALRLFGGNPDATLVLGGRRALPDLEYIAGCLALWLDRLLAPDPEVRPSKVELIRAFGEMRSALRPGIDSLALRVNPAEVRAEEVASVEVVVAGTGLPTHDRWLNLSLDGNPLVAAAGPPDGDFLDGEGVWRYRWTARIDDEGARHLAVRCWVGDSSPHAEARLCVTVSAEQLWCAGGREAAVEREPREEWLDQMQRAAAMQPEQPAFHDLLVRLGRRFPENPLLRARLDRLEGRSNALDRLEPLKRGLGALYKRYRTLLVDGVDLSVTEEDLAQVREAMAREGLRPAEATGFIKDLRARRVLGLIPMSGERVLGRDSDADIPITSDAVSGKHARLGWDLARRGFWIEDLKSTNGTWWGRSERLNSGYRYPLEPGRPFYLADRSTPLALFVLPGPAGPSGVADCAVSD
ncbi:MAG: FHA domain-containing protein [Gammaproteobacteria bacterium]|nr:FHA domain-containing protein [Gammaproteobacteria bacterium]MBU1653535.1 FHA domain-containing protein [Gammaproteobacteria bacterium]MBU1961877.1 FHA domain-containing protein [Gammaproteobacteria bacterium]